MSPRFHYAKCGHRVVASEGERRETCGHCPTTVDAVTGRLLTRREVAALFRVHIKSVSLWTAKGKLEAVRTPGGHLRYRERDIRELLAFEDAS